MKKTSNRNTVGRYIRFILTALFLGSMIWVSVYAYNRGFSNKWRKLVQSEFRKRGVEFDFKKLTIDPIQGVIAKNVRIYETKKRKYLIAKINNATIDLDLTKAVRKEISIRSFELEGADIEIPIDKLNRDLGTIKLDNVSAHAQFTDGRIKMNNVTGLFEGIRCTLQGTIDLSVKGNSTESTTSSNTNAQEALAKLQEPLNKLTSVLSNFTFSENNTPTLNIRIKNSTNDLGKFDVVASFDAKELKYNEYAFDSLSFDTHYRDHILECKNFYATTPQGENIEGTILYSQKANDITYELDCELNFIELLRHVKPHPLLGEIVFFSDLPKFQIQGSLQIDENKKIAPKNTIGTFECGRFQSRGEIFESINFDFHFSGKDYYLRNAQIDHLSGNFKFQAMQKGENFKIKARSTIDPTVAKRFAKTQSTIHLLDILDLGKNPFVILNFDGYGSNFDPLTWTTKGYLDVRDFEFNGVPFTKMSCNLNNTHKIQKYSDVIIERTEGSAKADLIEMRPKDFKVLFKNMRGTLNPVATIRPFNRSASQYLERYKWKNTPTFYLDGTVDTRPSKANNDLNCTFDTNGEVQFNFLGKELTFSKLVGKALFKKANIELLLKGDLLGGKITNQSLFKAEKAFSTRITAQNLEFSQLSKTYFKNNDTEGLLNIDTTMEGNHGDINSVKGVGEIELRNGDIFAVPALGPISKLLSGILNKPELGYSVAEEASATFNYAEGVARTTDFEAFTPAFKLNISGDVDTVENNLSLDAKLKIRGASGFILNPLTSPLLKFEGAGNFQNVKWLPKRLVRPLGGNAPKLRE